MTQHDDSHGTASTRHGQIGSQFERLATLMATLRTPDIGCPWDLEQSFETIAPYTIEEAYEVADAIARGDMADLCEELGDLQLQVVFHARMAEERGAFSLRDVLNQLNAKLVRRHPHVFGTDRTAAAHDATAQLATWETVKAQERAAKAPERAERVSALDGVATALPALMRAEKLQRRAAREGFDWPDISGVRDKLHEEMAELAEAERSDDPAAVAAEIGDLLFSVVNYARHLGVDPETALRGANQRFEARFRHMEVSAGAPLATLTLEQLEARWQSAKRALSGVEAAGQPSVG